MKTRAFFFGNMYLSSIQQGIQAGHVIADMAAEYQPTGNGFTPAGRMFYRWAEEDKVMILLNAGYGENIHKMNDLFEGTNDYDDEPRIHESFKEECPYPFALFNESGEALDGAATCFGCILPEKIYEGKNVARKLMRQRPDIYERLRWENERILILNKEEVQYNEWEVFLMKRLGEFGMAK